MANFIAARIDFTDDTFSLANFLVKHIENHRINSILQILIKHHGIINTSNFSNLLNDFLLLCSCSESRWEADVGRWRSQTAYLAEVLPILSTLINEGGFEATSQDLCLVVTMSSPCRVDVFRVVTQNLKADVMSQIIQTPIFFACHSGHVDVIEYLFKRGLISTESPSFHLAVNGCVAGRKLSVLRLLLAGKENKLDFLRQTMWEHPLHLAVKVGFLDGFRYLYEEMGTDLDYADGADVTPLMTAVQLNQTAIVQYLISRGCNLEARQQVGSTALVICAQRSSKDDLALAEMLLGAGADPNTICNGLYPIHYVCRQPSTSDEAIDFARILLSHGANVDSVTSTEGASAFYISVGDSEAVKLGRLLLDHGANPNLRLDDGAQSPERPGFVALHRACQLGHLESTKFLLDVGVVDVNIQDDDGNTPLHIATQKGNLGIISLLLSCPRLQIKVENNEGQTPYDIASNPEVADLLLCSN
ncbi:hypothetical protein HDU76_007193 [Blyttiomyces sp. JEL0837]|nr:hypothetical protein HDU76_007193 [Blyttiomyces sp. JEL0837]